jgi:hypothetical protein
MQKKEIKMRRLTTPLLMVLLAMCLGSTNCPATVIFSDNFTLDLTGGSGGMDYTALNGNPAVHWTVYTFGGFTGDVDLLGGSFFGGTICTVGDPVHGSTGAGGTDPCLDLAGSTYNGGANNAGAFLKSSAFTLTGGQQYTFSFALAGSQRGNDNGVTAGFMDGSNNVLQSWSGTVHTADPFQPIKVNYIPATTGQYYVFFEDSPGTPGATCAGNLSCGYMGALVDSIGFDITPEPSTAAFVGFAIAGFAGYAARRRRVATRTKSE